MIKRRLAIPLLGALLAGCALGPDYQRPDVDLPAQFGAASGATQDSATLARQNWREVFTDPALQALIDEALTAGPDALLAAARLREAAKLGFGSAVMAVGGAESGDGGGLGLKRISHVGELVAEIAATAPRARSGQRARQAEQ